MYLIHFVIPSQILTLSVIFANALSHCPSTVYLEIGKIGVLQCYFENSLFGVFWYDSEDTIAGIPVISYKEKVKSGSGHESGEYDIGKDGSLIIKAVSLDHERTFAVVIFTTEAQDPKEYFVHVVTTVIPFPPFPVIHHCGATRRICFKDISVTSSIFCSVRNARPPVDLQWKEVLSSGEERITHQEWAFLHNNVSHSTIITFDKGSLEPTLLSLLVCEASVTPFILNFTESAILVQTHRINYTSLESVQIFSELDSAVELTCPVSNRYYLVWRKIKDNVADDLGFQISVGRKYNFTAFDNMFIARNGSLQINKVRTQNEGIYVCAFSNGHMDGITIYAVSVYVLPDQVHPVVDGCPKDTYCVLVGDQDSTLSCNIYGIRPEVTLGWRTLNKEDSNLIYFYEERTTTVKLLDLFDIRLTSKYRITEASRRLTLECVILDPPNEIFKRTTVFDLLIAKDSEPYTDGVGRSLQPVNSDTQIILIVVLGVCFVVIFVISGITVFIKRAILKPKGNMKDKSINLEELQPMSQRNEEDNIQSNTTIFEIKEKFLKELREKYQRAYKYVFPIPFLTKKISVEDVYVDGGIELQIPSSGRRTWTQLQNCNSIFTDSRMSSSLTIIEGCPGMGKSTLALKFVCDWCHRTVNSPLRDVDIVLYLRLRQVRSIKSIFKAIRLLLLPIDSCISEKDITRVVKESSSLVLILDGYDEFSDADKDNDIQYILQNVMFRHCQVLLTTRTGLFPQSLPLHVNTVRLTGFDEACRNDYVHQLVEGNAEAVRKIQIALMNNALLQDILQVPMFFSMYANLVYFFPSEEVLSSLTNYFSLLIACFHNHMRNKQESVEIIKCTSFEKNHHTLSRAAFDMLTAQKSYQGWIREELCKIIGTKLYDHYVKVGILLEEDELYFNEEPGAVDPLRKRTHVTFFHKIFCEWFAAHYLSSYAQAASTNELRQTLKLVDPFKFQYLYRFACGLNKNSANVIIDYLTRLKSGDIFATLCLLEHKRNVSEMSDVLKELCNGTVLLSYDSSDLSQRSTLQLIELASKFQIPIEVVHIENCSISVDTQKEVIDLGNKLHMNKLSFVKELKITEMGVEQSSEDAVNMVKFALLCDQLEQLTLECLLLPKRIDDSALIDAVYSKNIKVLWIPTSTWYRLTPGGKWESHHECQALTLERYQEEVKTFREVWSFLSENSKAEL